MVDTNCLQTYLGCNRNWIQLTEWTGDWSSVAGPGLSASPDGKYITFTHREYSDQFHLEHRNVHILDVEQCSSLASGCAYDQTTRLTIDPSQDGHAAAWSPTNDEIAFVLDSNDYYGLAILKVDGSGLRTVVEGDRIAWDARLGNVTWSPDGKTLAFTAEYGAHRHKDMYIYAVNVDDSELVQLTSFSHKEPYEKRDDNPSWSPDGQRLAFASNHRHEDWSKDPSVYRIYVMNADGSQVVPLGVEGQSPNWSPDGSELVYEDGGDLYVVDENGNTLQLTRLASISGMTWLP